jgi:hypothetical protein
VVNGRLWPIPEMPAARRHGRLPGNCGLSLVHGRICDRLSRAQPERDNQWLHILKQEAKRPTAGSVASRIRYRSKFRRPGQQNRCTDRHAGRPAATPVSCLGVIPPGGREGSHFTDTMAE